MLQADQLGVDRANPNPLTVRPLDQESAVETEDLVIRAANQVFGRIDDRTQSGQVEAWFFSPEREAEPASLGPRIGCLALDRPLQIQPGGVAIERDPQLRGVANRGVRVGLESCRDRDMLRDISSVASPAVAAQYGHWLAGGKLGLPWLMFSPDCGDRT